MIEKIKQMVSKNRFLKAFIGILAIILLIFYFKTFFTKGTYFYGIFLKKQVLSSENHYVGNSKQGRIEVIVKGEMRNQSSVEVNYKLPNENNQQYTVTFLDVTGAEIGIQDIKDETGKIIFSGGVSLRNSSYLISKDGKPIYDAHILLDRKSFYGTDLILSSENKVSINNIVSFAISENNIIRGDFSCLIMAIFLFILTFIDIKYPLFFFQLRHVLNVKDPEPSDYYITMQRISWYLAPSIGIILMIVGIFYSNV